MINYLVLFLEIYKMYSAIKPIEKIISEIVIPEREKSNIGLISTGELVIENINKSC